MKIKPQIYARMLLSASREDVDLQKLAKNFWYTLQKNKQHKDLKEILNQLDKEWAANSDSLLVKAYSEKELSEKELDEIAIKVEKLYKKKSIIKNIVKPGTVAGIIIKIDDRQIDLSVSGKVNQLNKLLKKDTLETK